MVVEVPILGILELVVVEMQGPGVEEEMNGLGRVRLTVLLE